VVLAGERAAAGAQSLDPARGRGSHGSAETGYPVVCVVVDCGMAGVHQGGVQVAAAWVTELSVGCPAGGYGRGLASSKNWGGGVLGCLSAYGAWWALGACGQQ
jgi:hypothetical protein